MPATLTRPSASRAHVPIDGPNLASSHEIGQLGLMWSFRGQHYSSSEAAQWAYDAEKLTKLDIAEEATLADSYGTKVITHPSLATSWTPVLSTTLKSGQFLTHTGLYNVIARVYTTSEDPPWLRLLYGVGDIVNPEENMQVQVPGKEAYYLVNLGQVNIGATQFGEQRWEGSIQARAQGSGTMENVSIDRLWLVCGDESSGGLSASLIPSIGLNTYKARDGFHQTKGALNGKSLDEGGTWTTGPTIKADFEETGEGTVTRDTEGDLTPQWAEVAEELSVVAAQVSFKWSTQSPEDKALSTQIQFGSSSHALEARRPSQRLHLFGYGIPFLWQSEVVYTLTLMVVDGRFAAGWVTTNGEVATGEPDILVPITTTIGKQKIRIADQFEGNEVEKVPLRTYTDFSMWVPSRDAVMFADKAARLTSQRMMRQSETGNGYGPIAYPGSDLPRLPVSGPEERPVEIALKPSRGDLKNLPDSGIDAFTAQISYRPCWSNIPSAEEGEAWSSSLD